MYYPFLRGKQFDLLALNDLLEQRLLSDKIIPIIEPVRDSTTLKKTLQLFSKQQHPLYLIDNPLVGTYRLFEEKKYSWDVDESVIHKGIFLSSEGAVVAPDDLLIFDTEYSPRRLHDIQSMMATSNLFLIPDEGRYRRLGERSIVLKEAFQPQRKVEDYGDKPDDFFTDEHLFYARDGYQGFSDYTIEGKRYFDKGGPSRAIALHITYIDAYQNIRLKHFVSDSNEDAKDQEKKFLEALEKCLGWYLRNQDQLLLTRGMAQLFEYWQTQKFPGLGTIKKWSLAHHLELVGDFLDYGDKWLELGRKAAKGK